MHVSLCARVSEVRGLWPTIVQTLARLGEDGRGGVLEEYRAQHAQALQKAAVRL